MPRLLLTLPLVTLPLVTLPLLSLPLLACGSPRAMPDARPAPAPSPVAPTGDAARPPVPAEDAPAGARLMTTIALARACAAGAPWNGKAADGKPLRDDWYGLRPAAGDAWVVAIPTADGRGVELTIDAVAGTCDGRALGAVAPPRGTDLPLAGVVERARRCASERAQGAVGVCGSPLLLDQPGLTVRPGDLLLTVSYGEERRTCAPSGLDLVIGWDGRSCSMAPMD